MVLKRPHDQQQHDVFPNHRNPDLYHANSFSNNKMPSSAEWISTDPEAKRKKRVAKYKMFSVEAKVKGTVRSSCRWIKAKLMEVRYGWA